MKQSSTNITLIISLILSLGILGGCNATLDTSSRTIRNATPDYVTADYLKIEKDRQTETQLISRLRINGKDLDTILELAKLRESMGQNRLARLGYRQVVKATAPATAHNEQIKAFAAKRLAILRSDVADTTALASNDYRF